MRPQARTCRTRRVAGAWCSPTRDSSGILVAVEAGESHRRRESKMTSTLNKATIVGTIVRDPEFYETRAGKKVAMFLVATEATWFDSSGARCTKSISHPIKVYDQAVVNIVEKFVRKGRKVFLEGSIEYRRSFSDDAQEKQEVIEITLSGLNSRLIVLDGAPRTRGTKRRATTSTLHPRRYPSSARPPNTPTTQLIRAF